MQEAARVTLAVAVTSASMRLPKGWMGRNWRGLLVALGPVMVAMWGLATLCAGVTLGRSVLQAALIGAVLTPTDPVLAAPVVSGKLAHEQLPKALRHGITAESGANDGAAPPFVMLPVLLIAHPPGHVAESWSVDVLLHQVCGGIALGLAGGWLARLCVGYFLRSYPGTKGRPRYSASATTVGWA
jgi:NhaP-type Na+/H+ or K+/H+ antiporter